MHAISLSSNVKLEELLGEEKPQEEQYVVSADPATLTEKLVCLADKAQKSGHAVGLEVAFEGIQRPKRAQLIAVKDKNIVVLKLCSSEAKLEEAILIVSELGESAKAIAGPQYKVQPLVIFDAPVTTPRLRALAAERNVAIERQGASDGILG